jgi:hypothetical protein
VITKSRQRGGPSPRWAAEPEMMMIMMMMIMIMIMMIMIITIIINSSVAKMRVISCLIEKLKGSLLLLLLK